MVAVAIFAYQAVRAVGQLDGPAFLAALRRPGNWRFLCLALALMPLNWWLEARKWHALLGAFTDHWRFLRTLRATLAGVSVSAATPNRIGEIGGRLLLADKREWPAVIGSSLLGSLCQWVAFLLLAWPALIYTLSGLELTSAWAPGWLLPLGPLAIILVALAGKPFIIKLLRWAHRRFDRDLSAPIEALGKVNYRLMSVGSAYASLRFAVYCTQLYLLLWFFGLPLPWVSGMAGIMAIYLVQAGIPLPPGLNFVTRTELGLLLWQADANDAVAVLAAYTALFCVNVLLPSLPGYWLIVRKNRMG